MNFDRLLPDDLDDLSPSKAFSSKNLPDCTDLGSNLPDFSPADTPALSPDTSPVKHPPPNGKNQIKFLSFLKDDLIFITIPPNHAGWFEGYTIKDSKK